MLPCSASGHQALPEAIPLVRLEEGAPSIHTHTQIKPTHSDRQEIQGQCLKDMKVAMTVPLTLSQGLVDKVTLCLQLGDQVPAFQKLLQLLHHTKQDTFSYTTAGKLPRVSRETVDDYKRH